ncbi:hypothetical protein ACJ73_03558 [Blastomyces percursus]|uniref:Uncharacterized protein n=1 Tax=Blastomyces percursus TaxID=1658174 RepID=A0A1J9Q9D6_9EURO|nr:hypothetical protein ACJ73_03558 [Blastomyces percursus]
MARPDLSTAQCRKGDRRKRKSEIQRRGKRQCKSLSSLEDILSMNIKDLPDLVKSYAGQETIEQQQDIIEYCPRRLLQGQFCRSNVSDDFDCFSFTDRMSFVVRASPYTGKRRVENAVSSLDRPCNGRTTD